MSLTLKLRIARALLLLLLVFFLQVLPVLAHPEPVTLMTLDVAPDKVTMHLHLPLTELAFVFGDDIGATGETWHARWEAPLGAYLVQHVRPQTQDQAWTVTVQEVQLATAQQTPSGPVWEAVARLTLTPPAGVSPRRFTLHYDVIMHQLVTHKALVSLRSDWEGGRAQEPSATVPGSVIEVDTATGQIAPFAVNLETGSWWTAFAGMVRHGIEHIRTGTDHLLFLLVLLLPAPLLVRGNRWGNFGGSSYGLLRLVKIVTAFTLGHSLTLLIGALGWLRLPSQPVEMLIALSILVSALHALRPLFPGKELYVAAGFGLVHGLAFATVLTDLQLRGWPLAVSIFGFNLGIELMQLFVVAVTIPWLMLLSLTPVYRWVRIVSALLAALAACGWLVNRATGRANVIESAMQTATIYAPLGVLGLMLLALPAYLSQTIRQKQTAEKSSTRPAARARDL